MIELQNVSFSYDGQMDNGLHNVSLDIPKGQFVLLCGESGCGKTTVTRLINGLIPHFFQGEFSGSVTVCGLDVKETAIAKLSDHVGSVFQNPRTIRTSIVRLSSAWKTAGCRRSGWSAACGR